MSHPIESEVLSNLEVKYRCRKKKWYDFFLLVILYTPIFLLLGANIITRVL